MPPVYYQTEWPFVNAARSYPLAADATQQDATGAFNLPPSFLLELYLNVRADVGIEPHKFYLGAVTSYPGGYALALNYDDGSATGVLVATAVVVRATHYEGRAYNLLSQGDFADCTGMVVVGNTTEIDAQPAGQYKFTPAGGKLDTDCVRLSLQGIRGLYVQSGGATLGPFYGDLTLAAGAGMQVVYVNGEFRFDAIGFLTVNGSQALGEPCACVGSTNPPRPIYTINGLPPDAANNFTLRGSSCLQVTPATAAGLDLENSCATPCCTSDALAQLIQELTHFGTEKTTLQGFVTRLDAEVAKMNEVVLGSRLNDWGCT